MRLLCRRHVRLFWKPQRFPIADAHYAMGFAFLAEIYGADKYHQRAVHFLEVLQETRCRDYEDYCWGYPFDWETRTGTIKEGTPLITTVPYVYEAFSQVYAIDEDQKWLRIMRSIAEACLPGVTGTRRRRQIPLVVPIPLRRTTPVWRHKR